MTILSTATWIINNREFISPSENPIPSEVELENGVLVLLNPMDLITDGASNRYTLQCCGCHPKWHIMLQYIHQVSISNR